MNTEVRAFDLQSNSVELADGMIEKVPSIQSGQAGTEQQLRRAANQLAWLQSEISDLRRAVAEAKRLQADQESLLRNARVREMKLRAALVVETARDACSRESTISRDSRGLEAAS